MAEGKKSFVLYVDTRDVWEALTDEKAGKLIKHIYSYVSDENPDKLDELLNMAFIPIKNQLKRDLIKWSGIREKRSDAGKASAESRKLKREQPLTNLTSVESVEQIATNPTVSVNVNANVNESVNVNDIKEGVWTDSNEELRKHLCKQFGVSAMNQHQSYVLITRAITLKQNEGVDKYNWFKGQCWIYFLYKEKSKQTTHGLKSFIGELDEIDLGNWNAENWDKKYQALKQQDSTEPKANVQPNAKHRIGSPVTMKQLIPKK